jgi:hypothetical protein
MSSKWRRYEVMLPLRFNDGHEVPGEWLAQAFSEIVEHFGAGSYETQIVQGRWRSGDDSFRDDLTRLVVDVPDTAANRAWIRSFK